LFSYNKNLKSKLSFKILNFNLKSTDNFKNKNISTFQKQINMNVDYVVDIFIVPFFNLVSELLIIMLLFSLSLIMIGISVFIPALILTIISYLFLKLISKKQTFYSKQISDFTTACNNELKKIYDLSNELIFKNKSNFFNKSFERVREGLNKAIMIFQIINRISIVIIEFIIFIIIISVLIININNGIIETIIKLSTLAAISFRLIPSFSRCNIAINQIKFSKPFILETIDILSQITNKREYKKIQLQKIYLEDVSFQYEKNKKVFKFNLILNLNKNTVIQGKNGTGKSTLLKIIFGIYKPNSGKIFLLDGKKRKELKEYEVNQNITYIHQNSKIFEGSLKNNITLDQNSKLNFVRYNKSLEISTLDEYDKSSFESIEEEGKNISGGEAQKILIARAIYSNPKLIIFDETFSSIDKKSIIKIINNIKKSNINFFVISHNKNIPSSYFDQIIKLD
tara:strand:+ start:4133 stop:5494 length:1362 start_codon:yes stop_codon:yes gene_type:complete